MSESMRAGGCLCGAVRYEATPKGTTFGACHCETCRKWTGGPLMTFESSVVFTKNDGLATYTSSQWAERGFCRDCGSCLFYRITADGPHQGQTLLTYGSLDDPKGLVLDHEVYTDKKPDGYGFAGDLKGMTEAEIMAAFGP